MTKITIKEDDQRYRATTYNVIFREDFNFIDIRIYVKNVIIDKNVMQTTLVRSIDMAVQSILEALLIPPFVLLWVEMSNLE